MPCKHHGPTAELSHSSMVHLPCSLTKHFSNVLNPITRKKNLHDFYIKPCGLLLHQALIPLDIEMCKYSSYSYYTDHKQLFCWVALVSFYLSCMHILWECAEISGSLTIILPRILILSSLCHFRPIKLNPIAVGDYIEREYEFIYI